MELSKDKHLKNLYIRSHKVKWYNQFENKEEGDSFSRIWLWKLGITHPRFAFLKKFLNTFEHGAMLGIVIGGVIGFLFGFYLFIISLNTPLGY